MPKVPSKYKLKFNMFPLKKNIFEKSIEIFYRHNKLNYLISALFELILDEVTKDNSKIAGLRK